MSIAVVIATWEGSPEACLARLLRSMSRKPAGTEYDVYLVMNGARDIAPEVAAQFRRVFIRENTGYNLAAWDHAWRRLPEHDHFLFLQDDCVIRRKGWLADFVRRLEGPPVLGLAGEYLAYDVSWETVTEGRLTPVPSEAELPQGTVAQKMRYYRRVLEEWGVPPGAGPRFLASVIHFTSRRVLETVDGYNFGATYWRAIASEIAFSRKIEAAGLQLAQVDRYRFSRIGHREWYSDDLSGRIKEKLFLDGGNRVKQALSLLGLRSRLRPSRTGVDSTRDVL